MPAPTLADRALTLIRAEVGARVAAGREDASLSLDRLATLVEADPASAAALSAATAERRRQDPLGPDATATPSAHRAREGRRREAREAIGQLLLAGELVGDGPERVRLPGFGGSTWRAIAILRSPPSPPGETPLHDQAWAAAVAAEPTADLGPAAPVFLAGLRADPGLAEAAARVHLLEALRQDARHALIGAETSVGVALEAGHEQSAQALREDCARLAAQIDAIDAGITRAWDEGAALATSVAG